MLDSGNAGCPVYMQLRIPSPANPPQFHFPMLRGDENPKCRIENVLVTKKGQEVTGYTGLEVEARCMSPVWLQTAFETDVTRSSAILFA